MQPSDFLRVHHSLIAADALIDVVREAYDLGSLMTCRLLSASGNEQLYRAIKPFAHSLKRSKRLSRYSSMRGRSG